ncbi:putative porin [candidate division FCPU426 bacterium]|nr:putative porin [candidate division FCPU426 bacterium]
MKKTIYGILSLGILAGLASAAQADWDSWYEKISLQGDFRYRFENIQEDKKLERDRQRVRVRLNLEAALDDYWKVKTRLSTGGTDPVSTNQSMGDAGYFTRKTIGLDVACVEYKVLFENLTLIAGKQDNPFFKAGKNQLIWDGDLTLEGIAGKFSMAGVAEANPYFNGGGFWILEQSSNYDLMLYAGQLGFTGKIQDIKYNLGGSYYFYQDTKDQKCFVDSAKNFGNSYVAAGANRNYRYNYKIAEAYLELSLSVMDLPVKIYGNAVQNMDDEVASRDTGYCAGMVLNKAKAADSWELEINSRKLDKDAVVGAFSDSDFIGGGTDGMGYLVSASYMITDQVKAKVTHFIDQKQADLDLSRAGYHRSQVDVELKY